MSRKPINNIAVAEAVSPIVEGLNILFRKGMDGRDVALATISALRVFVLNNVGAENVTEELRELAENLTDGV